MTQKKSPRPKQTHSVPDEQFFRDAFDRHAAIMMLVDPEKGVILNVNQAAEKFYGYSREKMSGMPVHEINTLSADQVEVELHKAKQEKRNYFIFTHRLADGSERTVEIHSSPITFGEETLLFSIIHDVSDREQAEAELVKAKEKAEASEEKFNAITNQAVEGIALSDLDGNYLFVNPAFCKMIGYSEDELLRMTVFDVKGKTQPRTSFFENKTMMAGLPLEVNLRRKDETEFISEIIGTVIKINKKEIVLGIVRDITERKRTEDRLHQLSSAVEHSPSSIIITDPEGRIEYVNPKFTRVSGYTLDDVRGKTPRIKKSGLTKPEIYQDLWQTILARKEWRGELVNRRKNGELYWESPSISAIVDSQDRITHFVAVYEDITEKKADQEKIRLLNIELEKLAMTDSLTNLYNRRYFMQRAEEEFKRAKRAVHPLTLLMLDVDHFKKVNDTFGHAVGDQALKAVSAAMKSHLREIDILGRMGGEEFAVLLPNSTLEDAVALAERLRRNIESMSFEHVNSQLRITISIGAAALTPGMPGIDDLLISADGALYDAKNNGRNQVSK